MLVAAIPLLLLCFTNIGIIVFTMRNNRHMRQHGKRSNRRHQRLTIMLLSVTLAFIGLTCPSVIFICANKIIYFGRILTERKNNANKNDSRRQPPHMQLIVDICEALWYTKHAMNFILYTLNGQDFRREFLRLFTRCFRQRPFLVRKLLTKTQTGSLLGKTATNVQLQNTNINNKTTRRMKTDKLTVTDINVTSNVALANSSSLQLRISCDDKSISDEF